MRTVRATITSILTLGLLASSTVGVAAQEADPMAPSTFTVQRVGESELTTDPDTGASIVSAGFESTDQRASGTWTEVVAMAPVDVADGDGAMIQRNTVRLVNDGGSWVGTYRGFLTFPSDGPSTVQFVSELVGEGGYDGLGMLFAQVDDGDDVREIGVIVPIDQIPAFPDPPAQ
jgi:hypothetical protein